MVQDSTGCCEAISDVIVSEGEDEHFIYSGEKNLSKSLVDAIVFVEVCGGGIESITKFGDLGASGVGWDDCYRSSVYGHDEGDGR